MNTLSGNPSEGVVEQVYTKFVHTNMLLVTVIEVNTVTGKIKVRYTSGEIGDIPFRYEVSLFGSADVSVPSVGDILWVFRDASNKGVHLGGAPKFYSSLFQDKTVKDKSSPTELLLYPSLASGDRYIRSGLGASIRLNDKVTIEDSNGNEIILNSAEDKLETFTASISHETFASELRMGLTKRYNHLLDSVNETVISNPGNPNLLMSEFNIYLGKSLSKSVAGVSNYLLGSDADPNYKDFDFTTGKENTSKVQFSISDTAIVDINGDSVPTFANQPLNFLFQIADYFSFKVNQSGSWLLGEAGPGGINGLYVDNSENPFVMLGSRTGSQVIFHKENTASLENASGFYKVWGDGTLTMSAGAGGKVQLIANPKEGEEKFQVIVNGSSQMIFTADQSGTSISAGGTLIKFSDGEMQLNGGVNLGQPNATSLSPYEPALMGDSTLGMLAEISQLLYNVVQQLSLPLVGLASYPPTMTTTMAQLQLKLVEFQAKYGVVPISGEKLPVSPLLSRQVNVGG